jgi:hypothetical protein
MIYCSRSAMGNSVIEILQSKDTGSMNIFN